MTYVGSTLLVVNPFAGYKRHLHDALCIAYMADAFREVPELYDNPFDKLGLIDKPPHNYAIASFAFRQLFLMGIKKGSAQECK